MTTATIKLRTRWVTSGCPELIIQTTPRIAPVVAYLSLIVSLAVLAAREAASTGAAGMRWRDALVMEVSPRGLYA
jgi:hypothetical protein